MGHSPGTPQSGAPGGAISPAQAKKFFEFFAAGTHREVVFLGDLVEQPVHYVRSKGHKVLCGARVGVCQLCELAGHDADTSVQQIEYYAAAYVRTWRERDFHQRVVVFSDAAGRQLMQVMGGAALRGRRVEVVRKSQGTSARFTIDQRDGSPAGFPALMPAAFDLVPFIRARYGRQQTPDRPLVFLQPIKSEPTASSTAARPRSLGLSNDDCQVDEATLTKFRNWLKGKKAEDEKLDPLAAIPAAAAADSTPEPVPTSPAAPAATSPAVAPAAAPNPAPRATSRPSVRINQPAPDPTAAPDIIDGEIDSLVNRFTLSDDPMRVDGDIDQFIHGRPVQRGPKVAVYVPPSTEDEDAALHKRVGEQVCDELKAKRPHANGKPHATGTGGGK